MPARRPRIAPSVRKLGRDLKIDRDTPELRVAEAIATALDAMSDGERARMLGQSVPPLLRALDALRALGTTSEAAPSAPDDAELLAFLAELGADRGTG